MRGRGRDNPSFAERMEGMRNDYAAARRSRYRRQRTGVAAMGSGADYHYRNESDYLRVLEYARAMDRDDCIVGQTIDRAVTNTIQDGFRLDPQTGDDELDRDLLARWNEWAGNPEEVDVAGELGFNEIEQFSLRHQQVDGDILQLGLNSGHLESIEGHRIRTPHRTRQNVVHGVKLDPGTRRRLEYWVAREEVNPGAALRVGDMARYPVRDAHGYRQLFHILNPKRVTQTRGVSALAPVFDVAGMFEDINFAKLVQQQVVSCFAVFYERELGFGGGGPAQTGSRTTATLADGSTRTIDGLAPGMQITGEPGEKLTGFSPQVPNPEFFPHVKLILTLVGINLGMPLVLMLLDGSQTNFSGWRGAVDQARQGFRRNQRALIARLHRPLYIWKLRGWIENDRPLRAAEKRLAARFYRHTWNTPGWPYIEPLKDAQGDKLRLDSNLISPRRLHAERGKDWDQIAAEIPADKGLLVVAAIKKADEINQAHPEAQVGWRELAGFSTKNTNSRAPAARGGGDAPPAGPRGGNGKIPVTSGGRL